MLRNAPDILITTPESLFLLLTSRGRELLRTVDTLILDEVHAVAGTKRGSHLAISVERLQRLADKPVQRIGLSATQRPLEEIGRFVSGGRPIELVDAGVAKELDLQIVVPLEDMRELSSTATLNQPQYVSGDSYITPGLEVGNQSIWPSIYPALLELVRAHRSTIVFVNNRRLAERLALRLNELAEAEIARAHHGSLAREQRMVIEDDLKAGRIPCLVATSSLELGIDMGAVDLVVQVESPKSVARGLQRIGRSGHTLDAVSKGRIFPKFRADLLESAVVVQRMREGAIEETQIPRNPLDVLAQQIVGICAEEEIEVAELHDLVRSAYPFADLSRVQLENVLDMLAGRYPSDEFAELRPRIIWDRTAGVVRGREGARRLAVTNAGTIPDRGLFGVFLAGEGGGRVGELDEEMVYEARAGQVIMLGASSWRIEEITRDRVLVSPAPGVPGAIPFWKGEGIGRPYELGEAIGRFSRELLAAKDPQLAGSRRARCEEPPDVPARAGARDRRRAFGQDRGRRAVQGRDRRLAHLHPHAVRRPRARAVGDGGGGAPARVARDRGAVDLVGRRDRVPSSRCGLAAGDRSAAARRGRARRAVARRGGADGALRRALPRERRARVADPAAAARRAHAALAAAVEGAGPAAGGAQVPELPDRARDVPRVLPGRVRPAGAEEAAARPADAHDRPRRRRDELGVAVRGVAAVRLHRDVHVRGRHAAGGAACAGAVARPRPAARAARAGGAARADRPRRARRGGGVAAPAREESRPSARRAPPARRPARRRVRRGARGDPRDGAARDPRSHRRRGAARGRGGRRPLPRRARRDAARRAAGCVPRGRPRFAALARRPVRTRARAVHDRSGARVVRGRRRAAPARARARGEARARRAPPRRRRARVVRSGRAAPVAARVARRAAARGGAGGAGGARALPAELARDRPARVAARGADPAAGARAAGGALGVGRAAAPRARLPAGAARPALRVRRARLGRRGARSRGRVLPRGRLAARRAGRGAAARVAGARRDPRGACRRGALLGGPRSSRSRCPRSGISSGRAR